MPDAIVLHSGGMDSTVALLLARRAGAQVLSLGIDYGQAQAAELRYAAVQCARFGIPRRVLEVRWDLPPLSVPRGRTVEEMRRSISPFFLPGRNALFLMLAVCEAAGLGAREVHLGVNALDFSGYPDCRPEFLATFEAMLGEAMPGPPRIVAPLVTLTKPQIAALACELGVGRDETWSCYDPQGQPGAEVPCSVCDACLLHEYAWEQQ